MPTPAVLQACQATEEKLQELLQLQGHAKGAHESCPLCRQAWVQTAISARIQELNGQILEQREQIEKASDAQKIYQAWVRAQKDCPPAQEQLELTTKALDSLRAQLAQQLSAWNVPAEEIEMLPTIIAEYATVHDALNPPTSQAKTFATAVEQLQELVQSRQKEKSEVGLRVETTNQRMRDVLVRQNKSQEIAALRAKLQQQLDTLAVNVATIRKGIAAPPPADFDSTIDYSSIVSQDEEKASSLREEFRTASSEWANRSEQVKEIAALRREVSSLEHILASQPWNDAKQERLERSAGQVMMHQQLNAELSYIQNQIQQLDAQLNSLQEEKRAFDAQTRNVADLQAVSSFLSYDNGPQKFLEVFFQDTLNQTNLLISEMGLPVTLQMGDALEIMVQDSQKRVSSSLALGGGYANLIGIAFRIALQKMVLPRVNTIILDEPSTHVDEQNMELLIPFFERLKENLHTYGISQCIIIDHHPAWRNSSVGIINIGLNGENGAENGIQ
jgi:DNA repair exonuclease SbcCD ATPase subunit